MYVACMSICFGKGSASVSAAGAGLWVHCTQQCWFLGIYACNKHGFRQV